MSYRWQRLSRMVGLVVLVAGSWGCGAGDPATQPDRPTSPTPPRLLSVDDFATHLDDQPSAVLVNVHVPYEGHIEGTDAFVPFDEIELWGDLPANSETPFVSRCGSPVSGLRMLRVGSGSRRSGTTSAGPEPMSASALRAESCDVATGIDPITPGGHPLNVPPSRCHDTLS